MLTERPGERSEQSGVLDERSQRELLEILMPKFVLKRLDFELGRGSLVGETGEIAIVFVEIANYDILFEELRERTVSILDRVYRDYDRLCEKLGVFKMETVGKTYVAMAGLHCVDRDLPENLQAIPAAHRVANFALALLRSIRNYRDRRNRRIKLKIGINYGKGMMGVIGYHKPQFSIIGDVMNLASRLCTTSMNDEVSFSDAAFEHIRKIELDHEFVVRSQLRSMKGKGDVMVHSIFIPEFKFKRCLSRILSSAFDGEKLPKETLKDLLTLNRLRRFLIEERRGPGLAVSRPLTQSLVRLRRRLSDCVNQKKPVARFRSLDSMRIETEFSKVSLAYHHGLEKMIGLSLLLGLVEIFRAQCSDQETVRGFVELFLLAVLKGERRHEKTLHFSLLTLNQLQLLRERRQVGADVTLLVAFFFMFSIQRWASFLNFSDRLWQVVLICLIAAVQQSSQMNCPSRHSLSLVSRKSLPSSGPKTLRTLSEIKFFANLPKKKTRSKPKSISGLVNSLLPIHVQRLIRNPIGKRFRKFQNASVLFADIVGFTAFASKRQPHRVVRVLSKLFTEFDKVCYSRNLFKVYTIGDCYVALSFVESDNRRPPHEETRNLLLFAFDILKIVRQIKEEENEEDFALRVGIHTGEIIGGVVGTEMVRYDIYGDTVTMANKLESNSEPEKVLVSQVTKQLIEKFYSNFRFVPNKTVKTKASALDTFFCFP